MDLLSWMNIIIGVVLIVEDSQQTRIVSDILYPILMIILQPLFRLIIMKVQILIYEVGNSRAAKQGHDTQNSVFIMQ